MSLRAEYNTILDKIDKLRTQLEKTLISEGFGDEVMNVSRELDEVINEYYKIIKKNEDTIRS